MSMLVVKPLTITPAMLTGTDVPETDYAEWASGTTYALGDRVIVAADHKVYESLQASNTAHTPSTSATWWIEVSPTNRWKAFDLSNSTRTAQAEAMYFEIAAGTAINAAAILNCTGVQSVRYRVTDASFGLVYDQTHQLISLPPESTWYSWTFDERTEQHQNIDLAIPSYPTATLRIDLAGADTMAVGVILLGRQKSFGIGVQAGLSTGIQDYSRKEKNDFGDTVLVERAYARRASLVVAVNNNEIDKVDALLTSLRATPALWIASSRFAITTLFGFPKEFDIAIPYFDYSDCTLDLEGLT